MLLARRSYSVDVLDSIDNELSDFIDIDHRHTQHPCDRHLVLAHQNTTNIRIDEVDNHQRNTNQPTVMSSLQQSLSEAQALLDADKLDELSARLTKLKVGSLDDWTRESADSRSSSRNPASTLPLHPPTHPTCPQRVSGPSCRGSLTFTVLTTRITTRDRGVRIPPSTQPPQVHLVQF
jgi:hypothetical protein